MTISNKATTPAADGFAAAHQTLRADLEFQYRLTAPDPPPSPPEWLKELLEWLGEALAPVGRVISWIAGFFPDAAYAQFVLWTVLALAAFLIAWVTCNRLRFGRWRFRQPPKPLVESTLEEEDWSPEQAGVRSWLDEADTLARQGRYDDAVHHLLFRSVEDIARRRPSAVHPALTSREIAASAAIPSRARSLFTNIARLVEQSLFGGRPVAQSDWLAARQSYTDLTLAGAWRG